jgi:hypothetical protein
MQPSNPRLLADNPAITFIHMAHSIFYPEDHA